MTRLALFHDKFKKYLIANPRLYCLTDSNIEGYFVIKNKDTQISGYPITLNTVLFTFYSETRKVVSFSVCLDLDDGNYHLPSWEDIRRPQIFKFFEDIRYFGQSNAEDFILNN